MKKMKLNEVINRLAVSKLEENHDTILKETKVLTEYYEEMFNGVEDSDFFERLVENEMINKELLVKVHRA